MITLEKALELLKKNNIKTREELQREIEANPIQIGMFTRPLSKEQKK